MAAVLVEGGGADTVELAAGEHRLEQVRRVHRAFRRARADDGVELVEEDDDDPGRLLNLFEHRLEALFELSTVLCAGHQRAQVERKNALLLQSLGHVAAHDPPGQPLDNGRFANSGLAD